MELRHEFPHGIIAMEPISLDLSNVTGEAALDALERAADDAWNALHDFKAAIRDAETLIRNTGSIFGNARPVQLDASGCDSLCRRCTGAGKVLMIGTPSYDYSASISGGYFDCPDCGGTGLSGPVVAK